MFRHARVRAVVFASWQTSANSTGVHAIACRWSRNALNAWRTLRIALSLACRASELRENLGVLREAALALLREDQRVSVEHVELALRPFDGGRGTARLRGDLGRETRGPFVVPASDGAVEDADLAHGASLAAASVLTRRPGSPRVSGADAEDAALDHARVVVRPGEAGVAERARPMEVDHDFFRLLGRHHRRMLFPYPQSFPGSGV